MADYYNPCVLSPAIPMADMTACERLLLTGMFEHDADDEAETLALYSSTGVNEMPEFERDEIETALSVEDGRDGNARRILQEALDAADDGSPFISPDLSTTSYEELLQDIIRRSADLNYVMVEMSFVCSKMRADGFGGMAILITADRILAKTTSELLQDFLKEVDPQGQFDETAP